MGRVGWLGATGARALVETFPLLVVADRMQALLSALPRLAGQPPRAVLDRRLDTARTHVCEAECRSHGHRLTKRRANLQMASQLLVPLSHAAAMTKGDMFS
jgi:hypothetical protein